MQQKPPVVIRKYANRRLYDTWSKRYVNLEDIAALVRQGTDVKVVDARSGEDVTRVVLTQIIVEDAKGRPTGLPLELLRQLIVASDRAGQEFIMWYLKSAFDSYQKVQSTLQDRFSQMQSAALSPLQIRYYRRMHLQHVYPVTVSWYERGVPLKKKDLTSGGGATTAVVISGIRRSVALLVAANGTAGCAGPQATTLGNRTS